MDPWPDDVPDWVKTWEGPVTKKEWAFYNRVLLYRYAMELLTRGPITVGWGKGRGCSPQEIMTNTAKQFSLTRLKTHLKGFKDNPIPVLPKHEKIQTPKRELFSPGPAFTNMTPVLIWTGLASSCYPEHDGAVRMAKLAREIEAKSALGKAITSPWKSYWVCSRTLAKLAMVEYESMDLDPADRRELDQLGTIFQRTIEGRARAHATISDGADSGAVPDSGMVPYGDSGQADRREPGGSAVPANDDLPYEDMETDVVGSDRDPPGAYEEGGD